jgi:hypothetical protein
VLRDLIVRNRSYRRFHQDPIHVETLRELVELARQSASGSNLQPLKYILSCLFSPSGSLRKRRLSMQLEMMAQ